MNNKSWLRNIRRRHGWTTQPAKYISGFIYGLTISTTITTTSTAATWLTLGEPPPPTLIAILITGCTLFALLIGIAE